MKISELIKKLEQTFQKEGDIEVTIYCDQENNHEGKSEDVISTILWEPEPKRLMLCDSWTYSELAE